MSDGLITSIRGKSGGWIGYITRIYGRGAPGSYGSITRIRGRISGPSVVYAGADITAEPGDVIDLLGTVASGSFSQPTSWDWVVLSGFPVTIVGTAGTSDRTYRAPLLQAPTGTDIVFQVTAHFSGGSTTTATATHHIRGHGGPWMYDPLGNLVGVLAHLEIP